ncbi:MAG: phosphatase PAP2 family protein [Tissierellia bacterium]|nr:phosphatase PAP2 family protein [Tissierellia bacterium]
MKDKIIVILSILSLIIFFLVGFSVRKSEEGILFDERVMEYIHRVHTPVGINLMKLITYFGSVYFLLPVGIAIFIFMNRRGKPRGIILLIVSTLGSYCLNLILKNIFIRTRPLDYFLIEQGGYSFPSGHSMVSMTFYTTMTYLIVKRINRRGMRKALWIINFLFIFFIGFSRVYLGVHWPTDVLGGFLIGLIFTYISIKLIYYK